MAADRDVFHFLLEHHKDITRTVKNRDDGVETVTESDKKDVAAKIQEHTAAMHKRVKDGNGIRLRDPLFAEIFKHYDKIEMTVEKTEKGVKITETSKDKDVAKLIQAHAEVVSKFVKDGFDEAHKNTPCRPKPTRRTRRNEYPDPKEASRGNLPHRRRIPVAWSCCRCGCYPRWASARECPSRAGRGRGPTPRNASPRPALPR